VHPSGNRWRYSKVTERVDVRPLPKLILRIQDHTNTETPPKSIASHRDLRSRWLWCFHDSRHSRVASCCSRILLLLHEILHIRIVSSAMQDPRRKLDEARGRTNAASLRASDRIVHCARSLKARLQFLGTVPLLTGADRMQDRPWTPRLSLLVLPAVSLAPFDPSLPLPPSPFLTLSLSLSLSLSLAHCPFVLVFPPLHCCPLYVMAPGRRHSGRYFLASSCVRDELASRVTTTMTTIRIAFIRWKISVRSDSQSSLTAIGGRIDGEIVHEECRLTGLSE